ncbi:CDP-diacylglycerol--glycerol-3-phosphate 3-phosphatidyltransferase [Telmatospirillum siberiense]|uniref:CDP-diacylglycerol--glycerol-3-phosphate 3-phosphatidyltransferase n=1 Tax=Telmatospirillum siberiense TaxID=382514 RepID=A0A2N3PU77_9PROT|nr:CDP-diacylglycerol--glycerol-3-phosphate 3-phosphatidyltransferase [Telmatospirillum siberiense]PKU23948.1 CDP-diacylglycerol--glycerol-3-phosphate 3-phosphatidyltransferase [Telmatospirillum siberiense]
MVTTLPNLLTISRILVIPLIVATFYIEGSSVRWVGCALFIAAAITDFFDGYFARRRNSVSNLGRFLDPIADKLLVSAVLLMLTAFDRVSQVSVLPAVVILLREILVSGLREYLAELRIGMPVSRLAKWKTAIQMTALPTLIVGDAAPAWLPAQPLGEVLLWGAAVLTLITGWDYMRAGLKHMRDTP